MNISAISSSVDSAVDVVASAIGSASSSLHSAIETAASSASNHATTASSLASVGHSVASSFADASIRNKALHLLYTYANTVALLIAEHNYTALAAVASQKAIRAVEYAKHTNITAKVDELAMAIPVHMARIPYINAQTRAAVLLVAVPTLCLYLGVVLSVSRPKNAADPNSDRESALFHPTDNDDVVGHISSSKDLEKLALVAATSFGLTQVLLAPVFAGAALWLINAGMERWTVADVNRGMNLYLLFTLPFVVHSNALKAYLALQRLFNTRHRYRLTVARDLDAFPLGRVQKLEPKATLKLLGVSPADEVEERKWLRRLRSYTAQHLTVFEPTVFSNSPRGYNLVFDLRNVAIVPLQAFVVYLFATLNPFLNLAYHADKTNWLVLDIASVNLAVFYSRFFKVPRFSYAIVLLSGLFVYDVVMVFKTTLMMNAATKLVAPVVLLIPTFADGKLSMSFIGLGDVIIPAAFARLCLDYDYAKYYANGEAFHHKRSVPRKFFLSAVLGYILGLVATSAALHVLKFGQPALLYIVPSMLLTHLVSSWVQRDFAWWKHDGDFPKFTEEEDEDEDDEDYEEDEERAASEELFDEWVDRVELKLLEQDGDTDMDEIVYVFESDEDDETFVIDSGEEVEDVEESDDESEGEDLVLLAKDRTREASELYEY